MGVVPAVFQSRLGAAAMAVILALWLTGPVSAAPPDPPAGTPTMNAARIVGDDKRTRFVADLSGVVEARVFALADPYRIVVDLPEVTFDLPDSAGTGRGLLTAFRYGQLSPGKSRIVLDLAGAGEGGQVLRRAGRRSAAGPAGDRRGADDPDSLPRGQPGLSRRTSRRGGGEAQSGVHRPRSAAAGPAGRSSSIRGMAASTWARGGDGARSRRM